LTPDELNSLNHYVDDPFMAFACDEAGYPSLKQVLRKLDNAIKEGKLKLKPEKTRKAEQVIASILVANTLSDLHDKSMKVVERRKHLSISAEVTDTERELSKLKEELDTLERRKRMIEGELSSLDRTCNEVSDRIKFHKTEIEKNANDFMNRRIHVE
jgi:predicted RNase H-like nuclease (RuvC/YqgF family)